MLILVKGSVTNRTVGNALALKTLLTGNAKHSVVCARGDNDRLGLVVGIFAVECVVTDAPVDADDLVKLDLRTLNQNLFKKLVGKLAARYLGEAGIIFNLG